MFVKNRMISGVNRMKNDREFAFTLGLALCISPAAWALDNVENPNPTQNIVIQGQSQTGSSDDLIQALQSTRSTTTISHAELEDWDGGRLESLTALLPGTVVDSLNAGLSSAVKTRGFALSRLHYNGMPDIQRMFSRDLYMLEAVQSLRGPAAAQLGVASPGGVINYQGKRARAVAQQEFGVALGNDGFTRIELDSTGKLFTPQLNYRVSAVAQDGQMSWAQLPVRRHEGKLDLDWEYEAGTLGVELYEQANTTPFSFGTVISNTVKPGSHLQSAQVAWDKLFVVPGGAPSMRRYHEQLGHWQHRLASGWNVELNLGQAIVTRDESLLGYWTVLSPSTLSGYYTRYHDSFSQRMAKFRVQGRFNTGALQHEVSVGLDRYQQNFLFTGVQNIGGFTLTIANPDFSNVDVGKLSTTRRYNDENSKEAGAWIADKFNINEQFELAFALRQQTYDIEADRKGSGRIRVAAAATKVWNFGGSWRLSKNWRTWASASTGVEPNRGKTHDGDFLPAQQSRQNELGLAWNNSKASASVSLWKIGLDHLAMTDPADRNAVISAGQRAVQGIEAQTAWIETAWSTRANLNWQTTRNVRKTSASQGDEFVGVARLSAGLQLERRWPSENNLRTWLGVVAVGQRMANAANSVRVPGYARLDAGARMPLFDGTVQISVRNLTDIRYVEALSALDDVFQGARRQWWLNYRIKF